jgi:hypothetical protein
VQKIAMIGLIGLTLAASASSASAAWGSPAPSWFRYTCASPGAHFANHAYCKAPFARRRTKSNDPDRHDPNQKK